MSETATLAGGCFWCTEAIFTRLRGVTSVLPGYTGGLTKNPTYDQVCDGQTGHAEAIQVMFDPDQIPYEKILEIFWHTHNPTTRNQQGNDVGTQYRSAIFYHNEKQKEIAETSKKELAEAKIFSDPIVTEIVPYTVFYPAEQYHKNYFEKHSDAPYCSVTIHPKVKKLLEKYGDVVKEEYKTPTFVSSFTQM
ncbi:MAG: peptide-methionine (S)-S-oxide reductase MsrA [Candidatus Pacebacteria bacterium]|nr:peptide-methionine (S)-S-oxide reductase MsrA [Candidatus Paceibacterota bacterium]